MRKHCPKLIYNGKKLLGVEFLSRERDGAEYFLIKDTKPYVICEYFIAEETLFNTNKKSGPAKKFYRDIDISPTYNGRFLVDCIGYNKLIRGGRANYDDLLSSVSPEGLRYGSLYATDDDTIRIYTKYYGNVDYDKRRIKLPDCTLMLTEDDGMRLPYASIHNTQSGEAEASGELKRTTQYISFLNNRAASEVIYKYSLTDFTLYSIEGIGLMKSLNQSDREIYVDEIVDGGKSAQSVRYEIMWVSDRYFSMIDVTMSNRLKIIDFETGDCIEISGKIYSKHEGIKSLYALNPQKKNSAVLDVFYNDFDKNGFDIKKFYYILNRVGYDISKSPIHFSETKGYYEVKKIQLKKVR